MLLTTPTQGLSGATGPSSVRTLEYEQVARLTLRRLIAGIFAAVLIECRVGQCVSAVTVAVDYFERPFGVRVSGVRASG